MLFLFLQRGEGFLIVTYAAGSQMQAGEWSRSGEAELLPVHKPALAHEGGDLLRRVDWRIARARQPTLEMMHHALALQRFQEFRQFAMAAMRFDFELGDPSHLSVVLGTIRELDGVYESYRVLPGAAAQG